jgi:hypothetical protein
MLRCATAWAGRRLGLDGNPLRRRSDGVEAVATLIAVLLVVLAVPVAVLIGAVAWHTGRAAAAVHAWDGQPVTATIVAERSEYAAGTYLRTGTAIWTDRTGGRHRTTLALNASEEVGDRLPLWADASGERTRPPATRADTLLSAVTGGLLAMVAADALALLGLAALRHRLDADRLRGWDEAWRRLDAARR